MLQNVRFSAFSVLVAMSLGLTACGGGSSSTPISTIISVPAPATYTVGGNVSGLAAGQSVTLLDNSGDSYNALASGAFTFATGLATGVSYAVTVGAQPMSQICAVTNGTGTMGSSSVTNVGVNCLNPGESVLYSFAGGTDGANPYFAGLVQDASGNLYGTTAYGGTSSNNGTVFKITAAGVESVLYSFAGGADGANPYASLVLDAGGNLYGTTQQGGANNTGTVFKITAAGVESVLHSFVGGADGANPDANLLLDASGNLYGATTLGGANGYGTVFKITSAGAESVLHSFVGGTDGAYPDAGLILDASDNLYGTTYAGGAHSKGTVFKITTAGMESVLYAFGSSGADGTNPHAGLVLDASGDLYGTTLNGGASSHGTVFKIATDGTGYLALHSFGVAPDGAYPASGLIQDAGGNLYGTTQNGGSNSRGMVFKLTGAGYNVYSVLYSFGAAPDGTDPNAGLVLDASGNLYGTTYQGGASGNGTVFRIVP